MKRLFLVEGGPRNLLEIIYIDYDYYEELEYADNHFTEEDVSLYQAIADEFCACRGVDRMTKEVFLRNYKVYEINTINNCEIDDIILGRWRG